MASRATSSAADGVALSTPVTYCTILLRPVKRGFPIYRRIFARHLPGSRSNARTTKCLYSMRAPPEIATVSEYATGVSESFRQTGENVELSRQLTFRRRVRREVAHSPGRIHFPFKVSRKAIAVWRIGFCLIAMNARTRAAPSRVPRNETMSFSDSSPSCGAGCFFPAVGAPSKK
jgi:hypothetical protein